MSLAYFKYDSFCIARSKFFLAISLKSDPKAFIALELSALGTWHVIAKNHRRETQDLDCINLIKTAIVFDKIDLRADSSQSVQTVDISKFKNSDNQKFRFALLDKGLTCTFVFRNTATSGRVPSYYHLVYSHRRSKNRMAIFFPVNIHDLRCHVCIFSGRFPRVFLEFC